MACDEPYAVGRDSQRLGEERDGRVVRTATLGRGGDPELPGIAVPTHDSRTLRARDDAQPQPCRTPCHEEILGGGGFVRNFVVALGLVDRGQGGAEQLAQSPDVLQQPLALRCGGKGDTARLCVRLGDD